MPRTDLAQCLDQATTLRERLIKCTPAEQRGLLHTLVRSVTLGSDAITISVKASDLVTILRSGQAAPSIFATDEEEHRDPCISVKLPITIKRRGNEMRMIIHSDDHGYSPDRQLVSLIAKANLYLQHLTRAPGIGVSDVAKNFAVHRVDVGRILPLAFLAPKVVDQILTGKQRDTISARGLSRKDLPNLWVTLGSEAVTISVKAYDLVMMLRAREATPSKSTIDEGEHLDPYISVKLPVAIKRRGNEMRMVVQSDDHNRNPDPQLVGLVAKANLYLQHLTRAPGISVSDVAKNFGVHRVDVGRILPLAFLAPKVVDQILTGKQPDIMSARNLARADLPHLWADQFTAVC